MYWAANWVDMNLFPREHSMKTAISAFCQPWVQCSFNNTVNALKNFFSVVRVVMDEKFLHFLLFFFICKPEIYLKK